MDAYSQLIALGLLILVLYFLTIGLRAYGFFQCVPALGI